MARTIERQSTETYSSGIRGLIAGAVTGAIVMAIVGSIFALLQIGAGGTALHMTAGAAVGGIIGAMYAMIRRRR